MTPVARIISRCTQDIGTIDDPLAESLGIVFSLTVALFTKLGAVLIFTPLFLLPGIALGLVGFYLGTLFIKTQLSVKREMRYPKSSRELRHKFNSLNASSAMQNHRYSHMLLELCLPQVCRLIEGVDHSQSCSDFLLVSIRAFGVEDKFKAKASAHIDHYTRMNRTRGNLERWIATRIDLLGNLYFAALACYLVYGPHIGASNSGFSLNMAADFSMLVLVWVRYFNDFEVQANRYE